MSLVLLAHACSHLQNASNARLGLTSLPSTLQLHHLLLSLQRSGYVGGVTIGGPTPPPPSPLSPVLSVSHFDPDGAENPRPLITQENVASRRLWVGLKYFRSEPVLRKMHVVSKPTRRVWMPVHKLEVLCRGYQEGYVKGLRGVGESMYVTTDRGIMEVRECVERKLGGMILCRVNSV
ncbi:hypothetical protein MMC07_006039 [Pseudocyphellaria aurata]|nr:hypothetical protein [Pseudocyphellaria aurata]